jgi:DNA-binding XRE family transcriptional regulator
MCTLFKGHSHRFLALDRPTLEGENMASNLSLRSLRKKSGLNQKEFAKKLNVHFQFISNIERDLAPLPPKYFPMVSVLCNTPVSTLINMAVRNYRNQLVDKVMSES